MTKKTAIWNFAHSRFIKLWKSNTNTKSNFYYKHVLSAKVRAINRQKNTIWWKKFVCPQDQEHDNHYMTINKYYISWTYHLEFKIQISTLGSRFLASFYITLLVNNQKGEYCRITFYLRANNTFFWEGGGGTAVSYLRSTKPPVPHVITDSFSSRHGTGQLTSFNDCSTALLNSLERKENAQHHSGDYNFCLWPYNWAQKHSKNVFQYFEST